METGESRGEIGKKPTVVTFSANKGGAGKTRMAILTANCLGAAGKRVAVIDMDFNNSATFYYATDRERILQKHIADALFSEENNLINYLTPTEHAGVSLIASS